MVRWWKKSYYNRPHRERMWKCHCGGHHYLSLSADNWDRSFPEHAGHPPFYDVYFGIEDYTMNDSFINRVRAAWDILRRGHHQWATVCLDADTGREIIAALQDEMDMMESGQVRWGLGIGTVGPAPRYDDGDEDGT